MRVKILPINTYEDRESTLIVSVDQSTPTDVSVIVSLEGRDVSNTLRTPRCVVQFRLGEGGVPELRVGQDDLADLGIRLVCTRQWSGSQKKEP